MVTSPVYSCRGTEGFLFLTDSDVMSDSVICGELNLEMHSGLN